MMTKINRLKKIEVERKINVVQLSKAYATTKGCKQKKKKNRKKH